MSFSEVEIEEFKAEALELLELAEKSLLGLDRGDTDYLSSFDAAFRCFHSLKGASGMMDLVQLQAHTHELENILVKDTVDGLYRDIHSLKGSAFLFGYNNLGSVSHAMESSLEGVRNGTHAPSNKLIDQLFKSLKLVEAIVEKINKKQPEVVRNFLI